MKVVLHDGTEQDLSQLDASQLDQLHWQEERAFAECIRTSPRGSRERADAFRNGYDTITQILARRAGAADGHVVMGLSPRYVRLVLRLLERRRREGATPQLFEVGFGCGDLLAEASRAGFGVAGIEVSTRMLEQARAKLAGAPPPRLLLGELLSCDTRQLEGVQDVVYWNDVFEHLPTDESLDYLRRIHQLLSPGGALVTVTPNWHARPSDVTGDFLPVRSEPQGFHLKEYTLREMSSLLRQAGFARVTTPLLVTRRHSMLCGGGALSLKCAVEPLLEWLPFRLAELLVRGLALNTTIAWKR
ncbi:MAG: methyltransferase domain-containing protein [Pirellulaceae bacterium]